MENKLSIEDVWNKKKEDQQKLGNFGHEGMFDASRLSEACYGWLHIILRNFKINRTFFENIFKNLSSEFSLPIYKDAVIQC